MHPYKRALKWRLTHSRLRPARRLAMRMTPPVPPPPPIDVEIISIRAIIGGSLTLPYEVHWRGAITYDEPERFGGGSLPDRPASLHQALRAYFTAEPDCGAERLAQIGYRLPSLDEGDIALIANWAFIVTREGEFRLATHNRGLAAGRGALLEAALREERCALPAGHHG